MSYVMTIAASLLATMEELENILTQNKFIYICRPSVLDYELIPMTYTFGNHTANYVVTLNTEVYNIAIH